LTITTDGGTEFSVENGQVTIKYGGHAITVALADLREFLSLYDLEDGENFDEAE
jgi:hypothetical protein